jgi:hypothetical protein
MRAAWSIVMLSACATAPGHGEPIASEPAPRVFTDHPGGEPVPLGIRSGECPANITDEAIAYFEDRVLLRPPVGVTEKNFIEFTPGVFARSAMPIESSSCHEGMPAPLIHFMAMTIFGEVPTPERSLERIRDETLEAFGYPDYSLIVEQDYALGEDFGVWVYEIPAAPDHGKPDPAKVLLALRVAHGHTLALVFEVRPHTWPVIVDSLVASAEQLELLAP